MDDTPMQMTERLKEYVNELIIAKKMNKTLAIKGRTQMILTVLDKLRKIHKNTHLSQDLIARIQEDEKRAELDLPKTSSNYLNYCWDCYTRLRIKVIVDKRVDSVCKTCNWVQCPDCGACRDPKYGGCKDRVFLKRRKKHQRKRYL